MVPAIAHLYTKLTYPAMSDATQAIAVGGPSPTPSSPASVSTTNTAITTTIQTTTEPALAGKPSIDDTTPTLAAAEGVPPATSSPSSLSSLVSSLPCSSLLGVRGSSSAAVWVRQDRHDRILNFDCLFKQYVTEWSIEQDQTCQAMLQVRAFIHESNLKVHFPIEVRFGGQPLLDSNKNKTGARAGAAAGKSGDTGGDGIWLSPCYARPQTWIGIIMYRPYGCDGVPFQKYFEGFERIMSNLSASALSNQQLVACPPPLNNSAALPNSAPLQTTGAFQGKPHWAKNVVMPLRDIPFSVLYPRWRDFLELRRKMDPKGRFENEYIRALRRATPGENLSNQPDAPVSPRQLPSHL
jgi:hypothetical protein